MLPGDVQELMAKVIFMLFATLVLCFSKLKAQEVNHILKSTLIIEKISR